MLKKTLILILLFLVVRGYTLHIYEDYYYYYGSFSSQFAIANGMYHGHELSSDTVNTTAVAIDAAKQNKYIPLEAWKNYPTSQQYVVFPPVDLPGLAHIIFYTSKYFDHELTAKYAFAIQIALELLSLLGFLYCVRLITNEKIAFIAGFIYIFAYPYIWPLATQPARDMFALGTFTAVLVGFFIFCFQHGWRVWLAIIGLLFLAALLLWVRPTNYYYFFFIAPLVFFIKTRTIKERILFFLCVLLMPLCVFGVPFKSYILKHYGVTNTYMLGRGVWEGLGIVENNPYGFVKNDQALVPFVEKHFHKKVTYSSIEMNKYLTEHLISVLKQDPGFYLKAVALRACEFIKSPLVTPTPEQIEHFVFFNKISTLKGQKFFKLGFLASLLLLFCLKQKRVLALVLLSPLIYTIAWQIPIHLEERTTATAAWVLIFPIAWLLDFCMQKLQYIKQTLINRYQARK